MPEYIQLQTYATCSPRTFEDNIDRYEELLEQLGCKDKQVYSWLSDLDWPHSDDDSFGDIYALPFVVAETKAGPLQCEALSVSLYTQSAALSLEDPPTWLGFNLLFDSDMVHQEHSTLYISGFGGKIWAVMSEIASAFPEIGVYLTDEYQENQTWRALAENAGADPWVFDLGIFPRTLAAHFSEVPKGFQGTVLEKKFGFALQNRWPKLPWEEHDS
jgi:hypothetical protein